MSDGLLYHIKNNILLSDNIYRYGSLAFAKLMEEAYILWKKGLLKLTEDDINFISDGVRVIFKGGKNIILNLPLIDKITDKFVSFKVTIFEDNCLKEINFKKNTFDFFDEENPYTDTILKENIIERSFSEKASIEDLKWHIDNEDRTLYLIEDTDWKIQMDNELPEKLTNGYFIPKGKYHRLIKGTNDLVLKIRKH